MIVYFTRHGESLNNVADRELQAELRFGRGCPADRRRAVASAFWGLLASAPAALAN